MDLINLNLDDINYDEDDPEIIIHIRYLAWHNMFKKCKAIKKWLNKESMFIAWHSKDSGNFTCQKMKKKSNK